MKLLLVYFTICIVFLVFLSHPSSQQDLLTSYYDGLLHFLIENSLLSFILLLIGLGIFIYEITLSTFVEHLFFSVIYFSLSVFVASFMGLLVLLCIAFLQLNMLVVTIDINPSLTGVLTDRQSIVKTLSKETTPPEIIATADSKEREVVGIAQNITGINHIYGKTILPAIPNLFILPIERPLASMILSDNSLIVTRIDQNDLQAVGQILGFLYIKHYFSERPIKEHPHLSIMDSTHYATHREQTVADRTKEIDTEIQLVTDKISSLSAGITHDKDELTNAKALANQKQDEQDTQYKKCINAGAYQNNSYIHFYSESYCKKQEENFSSTLTDAQNQVSQWEKMLSYDQNQLSAYNSYIDFFKAQKLIAQIGKANVPDELGVFEAPNTITIALETNNAHGVADYIETLVHEYLHYTSFIPGKKLSDSFFEEGLTEYFARQAVQDSLHITTNVGYPLQVKIITEMTKSIDESEFEDIYFTKDEAHLEKTIDRVYGSGFYAKQSSLFQMLMFTQDPVKELQIGNAIMKAVGGPQLTEKDLESTFSSL